MKRYIEIFTHNTNSRLMILSMNTFMVRNIACFRMKNVTCLKPTINFTNFLPVNQTYTKKPYNITY